MCRREITSVPLFLLHAFDIVDVESEGQVQTSLLLAATLLLHSAQFIDCGYGNVGRAVKCTNALTQPALIEVHSTNTVSRFAVGCQSQKCLWQPTARKCACSS